jgi:hypothetical protein
METRTATSSFKRGRRYGWKAAHGSENTTNHVEQVMKPIKIQLTMGHDVGLSESYYKLTEQKVEQQVLRDYLEASPLLAYIDNIILQYECSFYT